MVRGYSPDQQPTLERLLIQPARLMPERAAEQWRWTSPALIYCEV
jgi:hypothetical protein